MDSGSKGSKGSNAVRVFDSCVWISLIEYHPDALAKIIDLARLGVLKLGVPATVRGEVSASTAILASEKKSWKARIGEVRRCARLLTETQRDAIMSGERSKPVQDFERTLDEMLDAIETYAGDPYRDQTLRLFDSKTPIKIPVTKQLHETVTAWGIAQRKPFGKKNSVADALILLSVHLWATKNPTTEVHFYTLNKDDFSVGPTFSLPHPDIAHLFQPNTNLHYHGGLGDFLKEIAGLDPLDYQPEPEPGPGRCGMCGCRAPIEEMYCLGCGDVSHDACGEEDYGLTPYRGGYLVDVGERIKCGNCGRKSFQVGFAGVCAYHEHMMNKDD